jgi:transcriptional regulator with XRE-family HTH domain
MTNMAMLGEALRSARIAKGVDTSEAAAATRLKMQMIEDLEENVFSSIAAPVYGKGFIRLYAEYLGLDPLPLIQDYLAQCGISSGAPASGDQRGGVVEELHDVSGEQEEANSSRVGLGRTDGYKQNTDRSEFLQQWLERMRVAFIEEPVKCSLVAFAVLVLFTFLVSGLIRCAGF